MRPHVVASVVFGSAALALLTGCGKGDSLLGGKGGADPFLPDRTVGFKKGVQPTPEQEAVLRVLTDSRARFRDGFTNLTPDAQPSAVNKVIGGYIEYLDKTELAGCPTEFKAAFGRHAAAWRLFHAAMGRLPDAFNGDECMTALTGLFKGGSEVRGRALGGDVIQAAKKVNATYAEVYTSAAGYGLEVDGK